MFILLQFLRPIGKFEEVFISSNLIKKQINLSITGGKERSQRNLEQKAGSYEKVFYHRQLGGFL